MKIDLMQNEESQVRLLHQKLLESWNNQNADDYSGLFTADANVIGFDGSQMNGRKEINNEVSKIFANHKVAAYVAIVREFRGLSPDIFLLRAVAGMVPQGQSAIKPEVNAIQTLIARKQGEDIAIVLFQNTPAAFHGRPELAEQLTKELQSVMNNHHDGN